MSDLLVQRSTVVTGLIIRRARRVRLEEQLAPVPGRVIATPPEHRHHVVPAISRCRLNLDGHCLTLGR